MGFRAGKTIFFLLVMTLGAPHFSDCAMGGRDLKSNEFPYTVFVTGASGKGTTCMGVLHGSITVVTAPRCFPRGKMKITGSVQTAANAFGTGAKATVPTTSYRYTAREAWTGPFTFVVANLAVPGIMVDPFAPKFETDEGVPTNETSSGVEVAEWLTDVIALLQLTDRGYSGVVPTPDKKVVGMKLLNQSDCIQRYRKFVPYSQNSSDITPGTICAVKADGPVTPTVTRNEKYDPVPPGYVCDADAGSPFIYADRVVGLLVKAFCDSETTALAVFLTTLPQDNVRIVETTKLTTKPSITVSNYTYETRLPSTKSWGTDPIHRVDSSAGVSVHFNLFHASIASIVILHYAL